MLYLQNNLELMLLSFIGCHLLGMSSASINPVLYGFLNESFKKEFIDIFDTVTLRKVGGSTGESFNSVVCVWGSLQMIISCQNRCKLWKKCSFKSLRLK